VASLLERFGDLRVVHTRFSHGAKTDVWQRIFEVLSNDCDNEYVMLGSTTVPEKKEQASDAVKMV